MSDIKLSEHFKLSEFTKSNTARRYKVSNIPSDSHISNLKILCKFALEPIRKEYGLPIHVSSGYRCPRLNELVGGVPNSYHKLGCAADISGPDLPRLKECIGYLVAYGLLHLDEYIEYPSFVHVALLPFQDFSSIDILTHDRVEK